MDLIEQIGPVLGVVAFLGLAVLAFLIFQQAREVRRLREWAGRAPERALEASEASGAASEARGDSPVKGPADAGRLAALRERASGARAALGERFRTLDRRLPVRPVYLFAAVLLIGVATAAALTGGFGLLGEDDGAGNGGGEARVERPQKPKVAVLNATQTSAGPAVPGLAHVISVEVVKPAGYEVVAEDNALAGSTQSQVMFEDDSEDAAKAFASEVSGELGKTPVAEITDDVRERAKGAAVVLIIGQDDAQL